MKTKPVIILPPLSESLERLREVLDQIVDQEGLEIFEPENISEGNQLIPTVGGCLILSSSPRRCAAILKENKKYLHKTGSKVLMLSPKIIPNKTIDKLVKMGLTECVVEPVAPKTLLYKVKLLAKSLPIIKANENIEKEIRIKSEESDSTTNEEKQRVERSVSMSSYMGNHNHINGSQTNLDIEKIDETDEEQGIFIDEQEDDNEISPKSNEYSIEKNDSEKTNKSNYHEEDIDSYYRSTKKNLELDIKKEKKEKKSKEETFEQMKKDLEKQLESLVDDNDEGNDTKNTPIDLQLELEKELRKKSDLEEKSDDDLKEHKKSTELDITNSRKEKKDKDSTEDESLYLTRTSKDKKEENDKKEKKGTNLDIKKVETRKESITKTKKEEITEQKEKNENKKKEEQKEIKITNLDLKKIEEEIEKSQNEKKEKETRTKEEISVEDELTDEELDGLSQDIEEELSKDKKKNVELQIKKAKKEQESLDLQNLKNEYKKKNQKNVDIDDLDAEIKKFKQNKLDIAKEKEKKEDSFYNKEEKKKKNNVTLDIKKEKRADKKEIKKEDKKSKNEKRTDLEIESIENEERKKREKVDHIDTYWGRKKVEKEVDQNWDDLVKKKNINAANTVKTKKATICLDTNINKDNSEKEIDYTQLKKSFSDVLFTNEARKNKGEGYELENNTKKDDEISLKEYTLKADIPITEDEVDEQEDNEIKETIYEPNSKGLDHIIPIIDLYYNKVKDSNVFLSTIAKAIWDEYDGVVFFYNKHTDKELWFDSISSQITNLDSTEILNIKKIIAENELLRKEKTTPYWSDHTFQEKNNALIFPYSEGSQRIGEAVIIFTKIFDQNFEKNAEIMCESLRGTYLQSIRNKNLKGEYNKSKNANTNDSNKIIPEKKKSFLGFFKKKAS